MRERERERKRERTCIFKYCRTCTEVPRITVLNEEGLFMGRMVGVPTNHEVASSISGNFTLRKFLS